MLPPDNAEASTSAARGGETLEISNAMVRLYEGQFGRGPESTRTHYAGPDLIICSLYGSIELLWTNDTAVPVLVRASSTPMSVTVSLYGDNGARRVRAESGPRRPPSGG